MDKLPEEMFEEVPDWDERMASLDFEGLLGEKNYQEFEERIRSRLLAGGLRDDASIHAYMHGASLAGKTVIIHGFQEGIPTAEADRAKSVVKGDIAGDADTVMATEILLGLQPYPRLNTLAYMRMGANDLLRFFLPKQQSNTGGSSAGKALLDLTGRT